MKKTLLILLFSLLCLSFSSADKANKKTQIEMQHFRYCGKIYIGDSSRLLLGQFKKKGNVFQLPIHHTKNHLDFRILNYQVYKNGNNDLIEENQIEFNKKKLKLTGHISLTKDEKTAVFSLVDGKTWFKNDIYQFTKQGKTFRFDRKLKAINHNKYGEGFSNLSSDGLRIYYYQKNSLYYSERESINEEFRVPEQIITGRNDLYILACWVSIDELELYYIDNNTIYIMKRESIDRPFRHSKVYINGLISLGVLSGFSMNPDHTLFAVYYFGRFTQNEYLSQFLSEKEKKLKIYNSRKWFVLFFSRATL